MIRTLLARIGQSLVLLVLVSMIGFALLHTGGRQWLLVKADDEEARRGSDIVVEQPWSVRTGRTWQEVAAGSTGEAERRVP